MAGALYIRPSQPLGKEPFEGDLFNRQPIADRLTGYIERLTQGGVFAIDAPWGEGKTWFGRNFQAQLTKQGFATIYIDAFENDYVDDPFMLVASELLDALKPSNSDAFAKASKAIAKNLIPISAKVTLSLIENYLLGKAGLAEVLGDAASDVGDRLESWIDEGIEDRERHKRSLAYFRDELGKCAAEQKKSIIIFIDELDRCKPSFAVQMIERIKHFFENPHIVFVLLLNREQLEAAIKGTYGGNIDASAYLGKFVQFHVSLPKKIRTKGQHEDFNLEFARQLARQYAIPDNPDSSDFLSRIAALASVFSLSFRELEQSFVLYSMTGNVRNMPPVVAWLIVVKLKFPHIFYKIMNDMVSGHQQILKVLDEYSSRLELAGQGFLVTGMRAFHSAHAQPDGFRNLDPAAIKFISHYGTWADHPERVIPAICEQIDLTIRF